MSSLLVLPAALVLDLLLGDPNVACHPVRLIGRLARWLEFTIYPRSSSRLAGAVATGLLVAVTVGSGAALLVVARQAHAWGEFAVGSALVYVSIAPRDLAAHARRVLVALERRDLPAARRAVAAIVGRATSELDETEVSRAAVEAVAESVVDAVTAPLFWAMLLGPLGAIAFRAVNTLDSLWGHKDARYRSFGWAAARSDDACAFLPARVTLLFIACAAWLLRLRAREALRVGISDGPKHASPNSGLSEAAFAGALGITLGGRNRYDGEWWDGPVFAHEFPCATPKSLRNAIPLMYLTTAIAVVFLLAVALVGSHVSSAGGISCWISSGELHERFRWI